MREPTKAINRAKRLRRDMTLPEVVLWQELRRKQLSKHFRRQHPVGRFVLDFYCSKAKLCVEVDGFAHDLPEQAIYDEKRDLWLNEQGIRVLRLSAADVLDARAIENSLWAIEAALAGTLGL